MPAGAQTVYSPLLSNLHLHYYNIKMEGISVDGVALPLNMVRCALVPSFEGAHGSRRLRVPGSTSLGLCVSRSCSGGAACEMTVTRYRQGDVCAASAVVFWGTGTTNKNPKCARLKSSISLLRCALVGTCFHHGLRRRTCRTCSAVGTALCWTAERPLHIFPLRPTERWQRPLGRTQRRMAWSSQQEWIPRCTSWVTAYEEREAEVGLCKKPEVSIPHGALSVMTKPAFWGREIGRVGATGRRVGWHAGIYLVQPVLQAYSSSPEVGLLLGRPWRFSSRHPIYLFQ